MIAATLKDIKIFFNPKAILTPTEKFQSTLRRKFGAYCRATMRNSLKRASGKRQRSQPGEPPVRQNGRIDFKDTIFFVDNPTDKTVVIGAVLLPGKDAGNPVPGTLEHGGTVTSGWLVRRLKRSITIQPRPYAVPAYDRAVAKLLPDLIAGGIMREV